MITNMSILTIIPFCSLLFFIATGPIICPKIWEHYYKYVVCFLTCSVICYLYNINNIESVVLALIEYFQFISLIAVLYICSSGINIDVNYKCTPLNNVIFLALGGILSNIIGTTGSSMLLIKPWMNFNQGRLKVYHIVFFIFIISNIGGLLTPMGDPPLFIGYLKGIPFHWNISHLFFVWISAIVSLLMIFYFIDRKNILNSTKLLDIKKSSITILGKNNILLLGIALLTLFITTFFPHVLSIQIGHHNISFLRELLFILIALISIKITPKQILLKNHFSWDPLKEISILFIGIFVTMIPMVDIISVLTNNIDKSYINTKSLFWITGMLSSLLDNAPTYLNMLTLSMSSDGYNIANTMNVIQYANNILPHSISHIKAISVASVFFGAMTYIGNGPNFMIKTIAENNGIKLPSFFEYILRYSLPILIPIFYMILCLFII